MRGDYARQQRAPPDGGYARLVGVIQEGVDRVAVARCPVDAGDGRVDAAEEQRLVEVVQTHRDGRQEHVKHGVDAGDSVCREDVRESQRSYLA